MKLISEGRQSMKSKDKLIKCPDCEAQFLYNKDDTRAVGKLVGFGDIRKVLVVRCPWCGHEVEVER